MRPSFRLSLAVRFTAAMALGLAALSALTLAAIRQALDGEINASLLSVASIQAATLTDAPTGEMRFHEWELTPEEASQVRDLNRFSQVWNEDGESLLRTRYSTGDLPLDTVALAEAASGRLVRVEDEFQGLEVRSLYYPLSRLGPLHGQHVLQVAAPLETRNRLIRNATLLILALALVVTAGTGLGSWWLAGRVVRPVHEIIGQAEEIGAGTQDREIRAYADTREYERLVQVLNTMLARLDAAFEAQKRFTADASHELRSPLTVLRGELELARRRRRNVEEYERVIDSALEEVLRLSQVADDLLTLARSDAGVLQIHPRPLDLADSVHAVVERLRIAAEKGGVEVRVEASAGTVVQADKDLVGRLLWNLVANAIRFTPVGGTVSVRVGTDGDGAVVSVSDTGPGIPDRALGRIFDRFYRVDEVRTADAGSQGTGLGLAIARAIADLHGADLRVANRPEGGAQFEVWFPASGTIGTDRVDHTAPGSAGGSDPTRPTAA